MYKIVKIIKVKILDKISWYGIIVMQDNPTQFREGKMSKGSRRFLVKVRPALTVFDEKLVKTDDKMSFVFSTVSGKSLEKITEKNDKDEEIVVCDVPATVEARVRNLLIGCTILAKQIGGATFKEFYNSVVGEVSNNQELYEKILEGDATICLARLSKGEHVLVTKIDLRGLLDFLPSLSVPSTTGDAEGGEEVEIDF